MGTESKTDDKVTVSKAELAAMIADAVDAKGNQATPAMDPAAFGKAVAEGIAANQRPKVSYGDYIRTAKSAFHPNGKQGAPKFTRLCMQNGTPLQWDTTHDREIELLNQITHSGRYINRLVEVVVNTDNVEHTVDVRYNNKTHDQQTELKGYARNFIDMLEQIVVAQKLENEERADRLDRKATEAQTRTPTFGQSKATQAARAAAGV